MEMQEEFRCIRQEFTNDARTHATPKPVCETQFAIGCRSADRGTRINPARQSRNQREKNTAQIRLSQPEEEAADER